MKDITFECNNRTYRLVHVTESGYRDEALSLQALQRRAKAVGGCCGPELAQELLEAGIPPELCYCELVFPREARRFWWPLPATRIPVLKYGKKRSAGTWRLLARAVWMDLFGYDHYFVVPV